MCRPTACAESLSLCASDSLTVRSSSTPCPSWTSLPTLRAGPYAHANFLWSQLPFLNPRDPRRRSLGSPVSAPHVRAILLTLETAVGNHPVRSSPSGLRREGVADRQAGTLVRTGSESLARLECFVDRSASVLRFYLEDSAPP